MTKHKPPAFQFYPKDFLSDERVTLMELDEVGAYLILLCRSWLEVGIPADPKKIAKLLGVSPARFKRMWKAIEPCWRLEGDRYVQPTQEKVRQAQKSFRDKQAEKGRASAAKRSELRAVE